MTTVPRSRIVAEARRRGREAGGNVAVVVALAAPVLLGLAGAAVDYGSWTARKATLQKAADTAALAVTRELQIGQADAKRMEAVARSVIDAQVARGPGHGPVTVSVQPLRPAGAADQGGGAPIQGVRVVLDQDRTKTMSRFLASGSGALSVAATARMVGGTRTCVIGLEEAAPDAVRLADRAKLSAQDCSVYANSTSTTAIRSENGATLTSLLTCSAGGYKGTNGANFQPGKPLTDCPRTLDPLADRPRPSVGPCLFTTPLRLVAITRILLPGTYCGGLIIDKNARVIMLPGVYVMKDGPLIVGPGGWPDGSGGECVDECGGGLAGTGILRGAGVGIYFTGTVKPEKDGQVRVMKLMKDSVVELTAPTTGPMAGLLFHEDRAAPADRRFEVLSDGARRLVGTIYVPRGVFNVSANQSVADQSEYTAIVTKRLELMQGPNLVLNTRYGDTDVPVPNGLGPNSGKTRLVE